MSFSKDFRIIKPPIVKNDKDKKKYMKNMKNKNIKKLY
jgi:hypothetical protein